MMDPGRIPKPMSAGVIEAPLAHARADVERRSSDEAQNTTAEQMKMFPHPALASVQDRGHR